MAKNASKIIGRYKNIKHFLASVLETIKAGYPAKKLTVIGVTGTDGKTTTAHLIYEILKASGKKTALISTTALYYNKTVIDTGLHTTTPDASFLQPLLKKFVKKGIKYVVIEVTSHGLDQHRVLGCNFWAGVLTNISHEHLDYHGTFQKYRQAKAKLFKGVGVAVLNKDDKSFSYFKKQTNPKAQIITYSVKKSATLQAIKYRQQNKYLTAEIKEDKIYKIKAKIIGEYNIYNILAACGLARAMGIDWQTISKALEQFKGVTGRMQFLTTPNSPFQTVVDFAHTPNALKNALKALQAFRKKNGRLIAVFGSAGERDRKKRAQMGQISALYADISILTAEDPRNENPKRILASIAKGARKTGSSQVRTEDLYKKGFKLPEKNWFIKIPERWEAIAFAIQKVARPGDVVGIFGKGHEQSLAFENYEHPWSDIEFTKKILKANSSLAAFVLAAGRGTRMKSPLPKVLHKVAGRPMISYILETLHKALFGKIVVIVSFKKEMVIKEIGGAVDIAVQTKTLGTGHAPRFGLKILPKNIKDVLVAMGDDSIFYTPQLLKKLISRHRKARAKMTLATIHKKNPGVVGYIIRDQKGNLIGIKEWRLEKTKPPAQGEINAGLYVFNRKWLETNLKKLKKHENGEYFITDLVEIAVNNGDKIQGIPIPERCWFGINTQEELKTANDKMAKLLKSKRA